MTTSPTLNFASMADMYERVLVDPLFRRFVDDLLLRAELAAGDRVLDVACGTGIVARVAQERLGPGARVVGVDPSAPMLEVARRTAPDIDWRDGNAMALPVGADEQFDVVLCQQGMQFFPDKKAAAREMRRVLVAGGRLAVATWRPIEDVPFCGEMLEVAQRHLGPIVDQRHTLGVAADIEALLGEAGWRDIRVETVSRTIQFEDPSLFLHMNANALTGMSTAAKGMGDAERNGIVALIAEECAQLIPRVGDRSPLSFDLSTNVATARA